MNLLSGAVRNRENVGWSLSLDSWKREIWRQKRSEMRCCRYVSKAFLDGPITPPKLRFKHSAIRTLLLLLGHFMSCYTSVVAARMSGRGGRSAKPAQPKLSSPFSSNSPRSSYGICASFGLAFLVFLITIPLLLQFRRVNNIYYYIISNQREFLAYRITHHQRKWVFSKCYQTNFTTKLAKVPKTSST